MRQTERYYYYSVNRNITNVFCTKDTQAADCCLVVLSSNAAEICNYVCVAAL